MKLKNFDNFVNEEVDLDGPSGTRNRKPDGVGLVNIRIDGDGMVKQWATKAIYEAMRNVQGERHIFVDGKELTVSGRGSSIPMSGYKSAFETNEEFEFQEETSSRGNPVKKFKLADVLPLVKLINIDMRDLEDGEETGFRFGISTYDKPFTFDGAKYLVTDLYVKYEGDDSIGEFGWIILKDDQPVYIVGIYEPHNFFPNIKRGLITFEGHEEIIHLWLDNGEFDHDHTR